MRTFLQRVLHSGCPIVAAVRPDATPDKVEDVYARLQVLIREAGLAA